MSGFVGLLRIALPDSTVLLSDGGFITFNAETYTSEDDTLGSLSGVEAMTEGAEGSIPALDLSFAVPGASALTALNNAGVQRSDVRMYLVEYDRDTNAVIGTPEPLFIGQVDQPAFQFGRGQLSASLACTSKLEVMFNRDNGNRLSSAYHKSLFAGETGHDNATGLGVQVYWGVDSPPRSSGGYTGGGGSIRNGGQTDNVER